jgi:hypothetical protein
VVDVVVVVVVVVVDPWFTRRRFFGNLTTSVDFALMQIQCSSKSCTVESMVGGFQYSLEILSSL